MDSRQDRSEGVKAPFQFKEFSIDHSRSAMKVGIDGILLGAWVDTTACRRILDVGTGTGLIAIMLAQRTDIPAGASAQIEAIELDEASFCEAEQNVARCPWGKRIHVERGAFQDYARRRQPQFDLIVCNPPFFRKGDHQQSARRAVARQDVSLSLKQLCQSSLPLMGNATRLAMIIPWSRRPEILHLVQVCGLHCHRELVVRPLPEKSPHRVIMEFHRGEGGLAEQEHLTLEHLHHCYTAEFKSLTRDFYLAF